MSSMVQLTEILQEQTTSLAVIAINQVCVPNIFSVNYTSTDKFLCNSLYSFSD